MTAPDLASWLLEQIADDEAVDWHDRDCSTACPPPGPFPCDCGVPARVLADCAAKRAIVEECEELLYNGDGGGTDPCADRVLTLLALPYADQPGYRPEWRP